jgi:hypothetical protein
MAKATTIAVCLAIAGVALAMQGCREGEQNRPLLFDKGVYQGRTDQPLDEKQVETLRQRTAGQKF